MISKEMLMETGRKKGLVNKEHIEKDYFQDVFLFHLFKKTNKFIFKGGTALYKLYGMPRFSEDLDFSLLDVDIESAEAVVKDIAETVEYFKIKQTRKTRDSLLIKLACHGVLTKYNTLRIDLNFKNRVIKGFDVKNYLSNYIDINPFSLRILKPEEIISEKIHSLFMRERARDLFDLFFLLRMAKFNKKLVEEKLRVFNLEYSHKLLKTRIGRLENVWKKELEAFILTELPSCDTVRNFVLSKITETN
jgi:predicted nucleotidyltransferase component of viral defense system